jgi:hypothetical protein
VPNTKLAEAIKHETKHYAEQIVEGFGWYVGYGIEYGGGLLDYSTTDDPAQKAYNFSIYEQRARVYAGQQDFYLDTDFGWSYLFFEQPMEIFIDIMRSIYGY